jgi:putative phosphoesterase
MVIAIISDTHLPRGPRRLPARCIKHLRRSDLIVHAGDFVLAQVLDELATLGPPIAAVHGNVDSEELKRRLPAERLVEAQTVRIGLIHDAGPARGRIARLRRRFPAADAVVFGHSHLPLLEEQDRFQIFNPGSPTERRRARFRSMGLARVDGETLSFDHVFLD